MNQLKKFFETKEESLPIEEEKEVYEINFDGNVLAEIEVKNNVIKILRAINGHGNKIEDYDILITRK